MLAAGSGSIVNLASIGGLVGYAGSARLPGQQGRRGPAHPDPGGRVGAARGTGQRHRALQFETAVVARQWEAEPDITGACSRAIPLGRFGEPEEIVGPALFLASDASAMVTGHVLAVDGGYPAQ